MKILFDTTAGGVNHIKDDHSICQNGFLYLDSGASALITCSTVTQV
ncbi:MAG: hypothetical protein IPK35_03050 [Saprospiraceae bacterium]|nr:hypothetical protein [Saprospiraceae bacterium]